MKGIFATLALGLLPVAACAADLDYSYLDLAYIRASNDFTNGVGNGYQVDGSWDIGSSGFSLEGGYQHERFGSIGFALSQTLTPENYRFGGGYHIAMGKSVDLVAHVDYLSTKTTNELDHFLSIGPLVTSESDHGYLVGAGVRAQLSDGFELDFGVEHDDTGFRETQTGPGCGLIACIQEWRQDGPENVVSGAARFQVYGPVLLGVEYRHSSLRDGNAWLLSARWDF